MHLRHLILILAVAAILWGCAAKPKGAPVSAAIDLAASAGGIDSDAEALWGIFDSLKPYVASKGQELRAMGIRVLDHLRVKLGEVTAANARQSRDIASLEREVAEKTHQLIDEHKANEWTGWHARRVWLWIKVIGGVGLAGLIVFANALPSGVLWGPLKAIAKFVVSIPGRVMRLFRSSEPC